MATLFVMQARSSVDGLLYPWVSVTPDWSATGYSGPGLPQDVALAGTGLEASASADPNQVTAGGVSITASGAPVTVTVPFVTVAGVQVVAAGISVAA